MHSQLNRKFEEAALHFFIFKVLRDHLRDARDIILSSSSGLFISRNIVSAFSLSLSSRTMDDFVPIQQLSITVSELWQPGAPHICVSADDGRNHHRLKANVSD